LLFTCAASPRTLSLAASLGLPRQGQAGRLELSPGIGDRLATAPSRHEKDASLRLLQPTPVTSTLRVVRFPMPAHRWMSQPGKASLDGKAPASTFAMTITPHAAPEGASGAWAPAVGVWGERGPGGAPIDGSSALHLPVAVFSTACRAHDVASGALCRARCGSRIRHRCRIPVASVASMVTGLRRRLVKDVGFGRTRTPSIAECSLPRTPTLARLRVGSPGARHRSRVLVAFATASRLPTPFRPWISHA